ncbi:MAG: hypothetical protein C5B60_06290, partial [Chloroflexi bacterium]
MALVQANANFVVVGSLSYSGFCDPRVFNTAYLVPEWDDDAQAFILIQEALFTNTNNDIAFQVDGPSLVGRSASGLGLAKRISLSPDFLFTDGSLGINWGGLNTVAGSIAALQGTVATLQASDAMQNVQIATLQSQVATLQATVVSLQNQIELIRETVRLFPTGSAVLAPAGGMLIATRQRFVIPALNETPLNFTPTGALAVNEIKATPIAAAFSASGSLLASYQPPIWMVSATYAGAGGITVRGSLAWQGIATLAPAGGALASGRLIMGPTAIAQPLGGLIVHETQRLVFAPLTLTGAGSLSGLAGFRINITLSTMAGVGGMTTVVPGPQVYAPSTSFAGASALAASALWIKGTGAVTLAPV